MGAQKQSNRKSSSLGCVTNLLTEIVMNIIYTDQGLYQKVPYSNEAELEEAIQKVKNELFGSNRIYLDVKKKIGKRGVQQNVPDGYLIDLSSKEPRLFFVENELIDHDALRHIAVQIMGFSVAFEIEPKKVRDILFQELHHKKDMKNICDEYISINGYRSFDHFLDCLISHPFSVLIVMDDEHSMLEKSIIKKVSFNVDVIHLVKYQNSENNCYYLFTPFLQDVFNDSNGATKIKNVNTSDVDTIVVPAKENGFRDVFLDQDRWYEVRMESAMREKIKHVAVYRTAPISAITHIATIKSIEPWQNEGRWVINFDGSAKEIKTIPLNKNGKIKPLQSPRYAIKDKLLKADTLEDVW